MTKPVNRISDYIESLEPKARDIIESLRDFAIEVAPNVRERISYKMLWFQNGEKYLYIGGFKNHIGMYPPIQNNPDLVEKLRPFANNKGNLAFKYNDEMPYDLIKEAIIHALL